MSYFRCHPAAPVEAEMIDYVDPPTGANHYRNGRRTFAVLADPALIREARELGLVPASPEDEALEADTLSHLFELAP